MLHAEGEKHAEELPAGWATAELGEIIEDFQPGFASGEKNVEGGVAHLRMNNIGLDGALVLDLIRTVPEKLARPRHDLRVGDVLVCTTNSGKLVGKCAFFSLPGRYVFSNHLTRLRPLPDLIDGNFLRWNLWLHWKRGVFDDKCKHWVNQSTLPKEALLEAEVVVPPLPEQRRIVAKLEALLGYVDACRKRLERVPTILKRFRQSVLAAACSGRLTADWREENPGIGDAASLVSQLEDTHKAAGGHKRGNAAPPTDDVHDLRPDELPSSWRMTDLRTAVCADRPITYGILKPGPDTPGGIPFVRVADFPNDRLNLATIRRTTKEIERAFTRARLRPGDILLSIRGTVGRICVVPRELLGANITQDTARLSIQQALSSAFVMWFLRAAPTQKRMQKAVKGVAVRGINIGDVRALQLPVPPLPEQLEIVRRVEDLFKLADGIEARHTKARAQVEALTPAILAKAFRGELVPQDPSDEPASVLLERIQSAMK